ncbi:hypothetical protein Tco_0379862, partial [Tanacetum coccineum]
MMKNDEKLRNDELSIWWSLKIKLDKHAPSAAPYRTATIHLRDHDNHHDDDHPKEENSAKRQKMSKHGTYIIGKSSSEQAMDTEPNLSGSDTQEKLDEFD